MAADGHVDDQRGEQRQSVDGAGRDAERLVVGRWGYVHVPGVEPERLGVPDGLHGRAGAGGQPVVSGDEFLPRGLQPAGQPDRTG